MKEGQAFCEDCRTFMDRNPVPPGTAIHIPQRKPLAAPRKKASRKRRELKPEEQVLQLRSTIRWLYLLLVVTVLAFAFTAAILLYSLYKQGTLFPW